MDKISLYLVALQYDSYGEKYLTAFDRMFIHKGISALLNNKQYILPENLQEKMQPKLEYIIKAKWESPY